MLLTNFIDHKFLTERKNAMTQPFYNTTHETGVQLVLATEKAKSQNELAEQLFRAHPDTYFTAEQIHDTLHSMGKLNKFKTPLTSVRRSLSTLKRDKVIAITTEKRKGKYGRSIHYYKLEIK